MVSTLEAAVNKIRTGMYFKKVLRNDTVSPEFVEQAWLRCKMPMISEDDPLNDPFVLYYLKRDILKMVSNENELSNLLVDMFDSIHVLEYCTRVYEKFPNCNMFTEETLSSLWNLCKCDQSRPDDNELAVSFISQLKIEAERLLHAAGFFHSETYKKALCKSSLRQIEEELVQKTWHPSRVEWWMPHDDFVEIFHGSCISRLS